MSYVGPTSLHCNQSIYQKRTIHSDALPIQVYRINVLDIMYVGKEKQQNVCRDDNERGRERREGSGLSH